MVKKFLRRTWSRYAKLGKGRKKKQGWRKPKGRDNKMRERRRGYPVVVSIGYKKGEKKNIFTVRNTNDLEKIGKSDLVVLGNVGKKKKIEIVKKAKEMKISFQNLNSDKFLKELDKKEKSGKKKDAEEKSKNEQPEKNKPKKEEKK